MSIAFCSIRISDSNDDLSCSGDASVRPDHDQQYGAQSALRPPSPPLAVLWDEVFSRPLSHGERICKAYELKRRLRDRIRLLPVDLPAQQYREFVDDWVNGRSTQAGVSAIVAIHVSDHGAGRQLARPVRRRG
jgi:hypothetical protein